MPGKQKQYDPDEPLRVRDNDDENKVELSILGSQFPHGNYTVLEGKPALGRDGRPLPPEYPNSSAAPTAEKES